MKAPSFPPFARTTVLVISMAAAKMVTLPSGSEIGPPTLSTHGCLPTDRQCPPHLCMSKGTNDDHLVSWSPFLVL